MLVLLKRLLTKLLNIMKIKSIEELRRIVLILGYYQVFGRQLQVRDTKSNLLKTARLIWGVDEYKVDDNFLRQWVDSPQRIEQDFYRVFNGCVAVYEQFCKAAERNPRLIQKSPQEYYEALRIILQLAGDYDLSENFCDRASQMICDNYELYSDTQLVELAKDFGTVRDGEFQAVFYLVPAVAEYLSVLGMLYQSEDEPDDDYYYESDDAHEAEEEKTVLPQEPKIGIVGEICFCLFDKEGSGIGRFVKM